MSDDRGRATALPDEEDTPAGSMLSEKPACELLISGVMARPNHNNPSSLLNAHFRVVPFVDSVREAEFALLEEWWASEETTSVRLFTGPGGSGKTRLFMEWTERLRNRGYAAGFVEPNLFLMNLRHLIHTQDEAFVVIDHAGTCLELYAMLKIMEAIVDRSGDARLRIAMVARDEGQWWSQLQSDDERIRTLCAQYDPHELRAISANGDGREQVFRSAMSTFAEVLGKPEPQGGEVDFEDRRFGRPLYLHLAALAAVEGRTLAPDKLLEDTVEEEIRYWVKSCAPVSLGFRQEASRLVTALTLRNGVYRSSVDNLDNVIGGPGDEGFRNLVAELYPSFEKDEDANEPFVLGLEPDLLGEMIVKETLEVTTDREFLEGVAESRDPDMYRDPDMFRSIFLVLGRIIEWAPAPKELIVPWIEKSLEIDLKYRCWVMLDTKDALGPAAVALLDELFLDKLLKAGSKYLEEEKIERERRSTT